MRRLLCCCIVAYQRLISPFLLPACRFHPSCSEYAKEALTLHGPLRGMYYSLRRILRCHPWHEGGVDLVPLPSNRVDPCHRR